MDISETAGFGAVTAPLPLPKVEAEAANAILHIFGALLAVAGLVLLSLRVRGYLGGDGGGTLAAVSCLVFSSTMILMFLASSLYHAVQNAGVKRIFRVLDHGAIYLFIAGTYTPFCLLALKGVWGWVLFGVEWQLAIMGTILFAANYKPLRKVEVAVFILMGWAVIVSAIPLSRTLPLLSLILLGAGGIAYTLGTFWYRKKSRPWAHVTWHVFVLAGAICHWWSIWFMN